MNAVAGDAGLRDIPRTIVVIGGGQAAGWVLKTLRKSGFEGRLVMIADEVHPPYERPPLSKAVLAGEADISTVRLFGSEDFAGLKVEAWQPDRAVSIDTARSSVSTQSGREVQYDRLVIATGGAARKLPASVVKTDRIAYLRTLDEASELSKRLRSSSSVLVIGGGWIGLEVAATARKLGVSTSVIEGAVRLCERSVPPQVSDFLLKLHQENGVDIRTHAALTSLITHPKDNAKVLATLADGSTVEADFAVAGIGLTPHTALAEDAGLVIDNGIVVDEHGMTSNAKIFACGDVANHPSAWLKRRVRLESWANAQNQAISTAKAALGIFEPYVEIPWFWSDQYDVNLQILGDMPADADLVVRGDLQTKNATLFRVVDGTLRGVVAINTPRELKLARKWMNQGHVVDIAALADKNKALA